MKKITVTEAGCLFGVVGLAFAMIGGAATASWTVAGIGFGFAGASFVMAYSGDYFRNTAEQELCKHLELIRAIALQAQGDDTLRQEKLAADFVEAGYSYSDVHYAISWLEENGFIRRYRAPNGVHVRLMHPDRIIGEVGRTATV